MPTLLLTAALAFLLSLGLTPALRLVLAHGGGRRRSWRRPPAALLPSVPRLGGVAVLAAAGLALSLRARLHWAYAGRADGALAGQLAPPVLLVLLVGVADDVFDLAPVWKLAGQLAAAAWVAASGLRVNNVLYHQMPAWLGVLLTLLWLVGCSNAFNLIDGLDGLATGLAMFATGTVLAHAVLIGEPGLALVMGALFGALAAFLLFNFPPATIYLGDAGSLSIGFILGCMALAWANKATTVVGLLAPFFALLVPMLDTGLAMLRRLLTGQRIFGGDTRHVHHRLLRRGLNNRSAVFVLYGVAGLGAVAALVLADMQQRHSFELVILLFAVMLGVGVQQLGYTEFSEFGRQLRRGLLDPRRTLQSQVSLRHWADELGRAGDYERVWQCLSETGRALDFHGLEFRVGDARHPAFHRSASWSPHPQLTPAQPEFAGWFCQIPLGTEGRLGRVGYWREINSAHPGFADDLNAVLGPVLAARLEALRAPAPARGATAGTASP